MKQKLLLLSIMAMLMPLMASADPVQVNGIWYNLNSISGTATVTSNPSGDKYTGDVVIPDWIYVKSDREYDVTAIGDEAFEECDGMTSVTIPYSISSIGAEAFRLCEGLTAVYISDLPAWCAIYFEDVCSNPLREAHHLYLNGTEITDLVFPSTQTYVGARSFYGCEGLTSVTIPNGVTSIGKDAFIECRGLTSVTIPPSVTSIGADAFESCENLTSIDIPNNVTSIGSSAFCYCRGLTSITIPTGVTTLEESVFACCEGLTSVTIPYGVTTIGKDAFYGCYGLQSVEISNSVTSIGGNAFHQCSSLKSVDIPNSVTDIDPWAFSDCSSLTSVTIGSGVTYVGIYAFSGCRSLTSLKVHFQNAKYDSRDNCNAIIETDANKLVIGCNNTVIPNSVTSIDDLAFFRCYGMTSFTIPNSVTSIGGSAFSQCYNLTSVTLGSGVTEIGGEAFGECRSLKEVYCYAEAVPTTGSNVFKWSFIENNATLYVPKANMEAYMAVEPWSTFKNIAEEGKVKLSKTKATLEKGKTLTLTPTVTMPDKSVTWKSSSTKVATVSSDGVVTGVKAGTATITCTSAATGAKATCKVTVGYVKLDQTEAILEKTKTLTLTPTVYPSSLTDKSVTWASSDKKVATVSNDGVVTGVKSGTVTITCTSVATGLKTTCKVTVGFVKLDKTEATLEKYKTLTLTPTVYPSALTDKSVTWKSSNKKVAMVANDGTVIGVKSGTATITCTSNATGLKTTCKVTVGFVKLDKTETALEKGSTMTLKATVYPSALEDKSVTWKSSNTAIATVTSKGKVTGVKAGTATITCTSVATGLSTTCTVTVGYVKLDQTEVTVAKGKTVTLTATVYPSKLEDKSVTWKSSNTAIATVTTAGKVKGVKAGVAVITCTSKATGLSTMCIVTVTASSSTRSMDGDDDDDTTGIRKIEEAPVATGPFDVYDLSGHKVRHQVTSLDGLPNGVYIVNGKKMLKKN